MTVTTSPKIKVTPADFNTFPFPTWPTKKAREEWWRKQLADSHCFAVAALVLIYNYQTADEKEYDATSHDNGVGFGGSDAEFLSSLAKQFLKYGTLSEKQFAVLHKRIGKYAPQLIGHLTSQGVALTVSKAEAAVEVPAVEKGIEIDLGLPAPALFATSEIVVPPVVKPAGPDWAVYQNLLTLSQKNVVDFIALAEQYIGKADQFANDVFATVKGKQQVSYKQAKAIAFGCAKGNGGVQ